MEPRQQPLGMLIVTYILAAFWGMYVLIRCIWTILRVGTTGFFHVKDRCERPRILENPDLGTHAFVKLSEVKLHYVAAGEESKPLMLMVHGFPDFWFSWRFQILEFSKNFRVVAMDMRGYGESDKPRGVENYRIETLGNDLKELVTALGYEKCTLVAHDWGAAAACQFALDNPEMVEKFILCNSGHVRAFREVLESSFKQFIMAWYMFFFQLPYLPEMVIRSRDFYLVEELFNLQPLPDVSRLVADPDELEAFKWSLSQPYGITGPLNYYRAAFRYNPRRPSQGYNLQMPTLIIWGTNDFAVSTSNIHISAKWIPDLRVKFITSAGHWVHQQEPGKVNKYIHEFLNKA